MKGYWHIIINKGEIMTLLNFFNKKAREGYYIKTLQCTNCGHEEDYEIEKGTTLKEFTKRIPCKNCGNKELRMHEYHDTLY